MSVRAVAVVALLAGVLLSSVHALADDGSTRSPHARALQLVLQSQATDLDAVDRALPREHDTLSRDWSVRRPVAPGFIDTRGLLEVTYRIDGAAVARWQVDLVQASVTPSPLAVSPVSSDAASADARRPEPHRPQEHP
ncbi:MAG: hypothetical protein ABW178_12020 [Pseudoxanthomonas sp.]